VTAQGQPRAIFKRAIDRGNILVAEATALPGAHSPKADADLVADRPKGHGGAGDIVVT